MQFAATDGFTLHGTLYEGGADEILIASALGVKRRYYDAFAQAAVARGFTVFTFDYRGIGESRPSSLRGFKASMHDWGALDLPAAIDQLKGARSITLVGHSAGGQIPGLASNANALDRLVFVAAQAGYYGNYPGLHRHSIRVIWHLMPFASRVIGYFPSRALGLGSEDLPTGVATQLNEGLNLRPRFARNRERERPGKQPAGLQRGRLRSGFGGQRRGRRRAPGGAPQA